MKIAFVIPTLEIMGGAERIIVDKANYLSTKFFYDITIITQYHHKNAPVIYPLSEKVHHINLGIPYYSQYKYRYPKRLWLRWKLNNLLRDETTAAVLQIDPDILIGVSYFKPNIVCNIPCRASKIIESHEPRILLKSVLLTGSKILSYFTYLYTKTIEDKADIVVCLTNEAKKQWRKAKRVEVIPNFSSIKIKQHSNCNTKRVIAVGRLTSVKGYDRLIKIWGTVSLKHPDWQLNIFGEGSLKDDLNKLINDNNINNIALCGTTQNISLEYANSSICVLTSYYEGFSLVILEAMMHGVPCVAFDCPDGPRSIISNNEDGFLINNGNNTLFAERLCELIENQQLRHRFSYAAIKKVQIFDIDTIMRQWKSLFESLTDANN